MNDYSSLLTKRVFDEQFFHPLKKVKYCDPLSSENLDREGVIEKVMAEAQISFSDREKRIITIDQNIKLIAKYTQNANRGKIEEEVFQAAIICGKKHLVAPVKSITIPGMNQDIALQLYLDSDEFVLLNDCSMNEFSNKFFTFEKVTEAVIFEFVFGMTDCIAENLILNIVNGDIIHFDNEHSWRTPNTMTKADGCETPFASTLLSLKESHQSINSSLREFIQKEIDNYKSKLNELNELLMKHNENHENIISSMDERLNFLQKSVDNTTLVDIILSSNKDFKKIIYLKLAILIFNQISDDQSSSNEESILPFLQEIKRNVFTDSCGLGNFWPDLICEIDNETMTNAIIDKINELLESNIDEYLPEISFFLNSEEILSLSDRQEDDLLPLISVI